MAPLAKPMAPKHRALSRRDRDSVELLARSSSLEGSTVSDALLQAGGGAEACPAGGRRDGAAGQAGQVGVGLEGVGVLMVRAVQGGICGAFDGTIRAGKCCLWLL